MKVKVKKLHPDAVIPKYATPGAAAFDFVSIEDVTLEPGETKLIKTGLAVEVEPGYELQVRPRSGLSLKTFLRVANSPGTVDSDFRGQVCVIMTNSRYIEHNTLVTARQLGTVVGNEFIKKGDRIAQGAVCPVQQVEFEVVEDLTDTQRGSGGFGSTGV